MARELRGSDQARRAGLWDEVRPEALVPTERNPITGSLTASGDSDGGAKDRRTESSRSDASPQAGPRWVRGRWPVVATAGAVALVVGVGGAVALANRGDGPRSAGPSPTATPSATAGSPSPTQPGTVTTGLGFDERVYRGTLTSISEGDVLSSGTAPARVLCEEQCRLFSIATEREVTWPLGQTDVTVTLPQEGDISAWCGDGTFRPAEVWQISFTEDDLTFTSVSPAVPPVKCPDGINTSLPDSRLEFSGTSTG